MSFSLKNLGRIAVVCCITLLTMLIWPGYALAISCSSGWGGERELAPSLKKILINKIAIPVDSSDLSSAASFRKMLISFNAKTGATIESGSDLNLKSLADATGYAFVEFRIHTSLSQIPVIKGYLENKYLGAAGEIEVSNVNALLILKGSDDKEVTNYPFELKKGLNQIPICEFGKFKKDIKNIDIRVKSFTGSFSMNHSFD